MKDSKALWNAVASASFFTVIVGTVNGASIYLLLLGGVRLAELFGWLPSAWEDTHRLILTVVTVVLALPVTGVGSVWMFRNALAGERAIERDGDPE